MTKQWADEILEVKPELERLAGGPVYLEPFDWFFSIGCRVGGRKDAIRIDKVKYKDPLSGEWRALDGTFNVEANFEQMEKVRTSPEEAKALLIKYVRGVAAQ